MSRRRICILILCIITIIMMFLVIIIFNENNKRCSYKLDIKSNISDIYGRKLESYLVTQKGTLLFFFNTDCEFCLDELSFVKNNREELTNKYNIILVSFEDEIKIKKYKEYLLGNSDNRLFFISDPQFNIIDKYNVSEFPSTFIFSSDGNELYNYRGYDISTFKKLINL